MNTIHKKEQSTVTRIVIGLCIFLVLFGLLYCVSLITKVSKSNTYKLNVANKESLVLAEVRSSIAQSELDGTGKLSLSSCQKLETIAKNLSQKADWFSSCGNTLVGSIPDTGNTKVTKISDGNYCATYVTNNDISILTNYEFTTGICGDSRFDID